VSLRGNPGRNDLQKKKRKGGVLTGCGKPAFVRVSLDDPAPREGKKKKKRKARPKDYSIILRYASEPTGVSGREKKGGKEKRGGNCFGNPTNPYHRPMDRVLRYTVPPGKENEKERGTSRRDWVPSPGSVPVA